jgi:hypothetical protein
MALASLTFLLPATTALAASTPAATETSSDYFNNIESTNLGWVFSVTSTVQVTGLGYYDYTADPAHPGLFCCATDNRTSGGLLDNHMVGIFDSSGNLLASANVPAGEAGVLIGDFRYVPISSLTLTPGVYVVDGTQQGTGLAVPTDPVVFDFSTFATISSIADLGGTYTGNGSPATLAFPGIGGNPYLAYMGPNFIVSTGVPEPSTWAMLLAGFGIVGAAAGRRRQTRGAAAVA